jgi:hypothetical protein
VGGPEGLLLAVEGDLGAEIVQAPSEKGRAGETCDYASAKVSGCVACLTTHPTSLLRIRIVSGCVNRSTTHPTKLLRVQLRFFASDKASGCVDLLTTHPIMALHIQLRFFASSSPMDT